MDQKRTSAPHGGPDVASPPVGATADEAAAALGRKLESAADVMRTRLPQEGRTGAVVEAVSDRLEASGEYLAQEGLSGILQDVEVLIRQYPIQALLLGLGAGYLLSRLVGGRHG
jgi:hypothetical protein